MSHLDPIPRFADGQVDIPGIHDSTLAACWISPSRDLVLRFRPADPGIPEIDVRVAAVASAEVWCGGSVMPMIVGRLSVCEGGDFDAWLSMRAESDMIERFRKSLCRNVNPQWLLVVEPILGDVIIVSGNEPFDTSVTTDVSLLE
jgi:hypothetical protein